MSTSAAAQQGVIQFTLLTKHVKTCLVSLVQRWVNCEHIPVFKGTHWSLKMVPTNRRQYLQQASEYPIRHIFTVLAFAGNPLLQAFSSLLQNVTRVVSSHKAEGGRRELLNVDQLRAALHINAGARPLPLFVVGALGATEQ
mgnify:CR=1 FL=1